jgi:hypothetical protein
MPLLFDDLPWQRRCRDCREPKDIREFYDHPSITGKDTRCKECAKQYERERRKDPDVAATINDRDRVRRSSLKYRENKNAHRRHRRQTDIGFTLSAAIRGALRRVLLASKQGKDDQTFRMVGYTPEKLKQRLECQFHSGMSWENYGEWVIDHKKPIAAFIEQNVTDPRLINALCNLQPMWWDDNARKGDTWRPKDPATNDNAAYNQKVAA